MPRTPLEPFLFLNQLEISSGNIRWEKSGNSIPPLKYFAAPLLVLVVGEENLVIGFGPPTLEMLPPSLVQTMELFHLTKFTGAFSRSFTTESTKSLASQQQARREGGGRRGHYTGARGLEL